MVSSKSLLTPLQLDLLNAFFRAVQGFYLTGGAALAGFYLCHRPTSDLDLFSLDDDIFESGFNSLVKVANSIGATCETRQHYPDFRRVWVERGEDSIVVDLVRERVAQLFGEKPVQDGVRLDPIEEIFTNKLTVLISRGEIRDLIDVMSLEEYGLRVEDHLSAALEKDGGCTPATLAWVLSQIEIPENASLPGQVDTTTLRKYLADLIERLRKAAFPQP